MARRRKSEEEHENHERWLVSYADFITLLFAFFVVMYSLSSINEGKYRVLSDSIVQAFRNVEMNASGNRLMMPSGTPPIMVMPPKPNADTNTRPDPEAEARKQAAVERMRGMAEEIKQSMESLSKDGQVKVTEGARGITVEINASLLFTPGEAVLGPPAVKALRSVAEVVAGASFPIVVEGHTDTTPINTYRYPSNWELSSARASSVVRLFVESGVNPGRMTVAGYGDQRPAADNASEAGRSRNRRVTIFMESLTAEVAPAPPVRLRPNDTIQSILPADANPPAPASP
ncbi:MAG: flagellar motor protein MotD [Rhodocyclaceae bacterium]|nr:flagellar motor protein MotD [Rhodocyclaceae bacterium]